MSIVSWIQCIIYTKSRNSAYAGDWSRVLNIRLNIILDRILVSRHVLSTHLMVHPSGSLRTGSAGKAEGRGGVFTWKPRHIGAKVCTAGRLSASWSAPRTDVHLSPNLRGPRHTLDSEPRESQEMRWRWCLRGVGERNPLFYRKIWNL